MHKIHKECLTNMSSPTTPGWILLESLMNYLINQFYILLPKALHFFTFDWYIIAGWIVYHNRAISSVCDSSSNVTVRLTQVPRPPPSCWPAWRHCSRHRTATCGAPAHHTAPGPCGSQHALPAARPWLPQRTCAGEEGGGSQWYSKQELYHTTFREIVLYKEHGNLLTAIQEFRLGTLG